MSERNPSRVVLALCRSETERLETERLETERSTFPCRFRNAAGLNNGDAGSDRPASPVAVFGRD